MPEQTRSQLLADLTKHTGYEVLMEDVLEKIIEEEVKRLWIAKGPQARVYQLEVVTYMKAFYESIKTRVANTLLTAQQQQMKGKKNVQEIQRTGRR